MDAAAHLRGMTDDVIDAVPEADDPLVEHFIARFQLSGVPLHLPYSDRGYDPNFCHLSAKHCAMTHGGRRVHGWALWKFEDQLVGEHHSVWENPVGELIDVTPPKFGADRILFVRDDIADLVEMNGVYVMWADRTTIPHVPFAFQGEQIHKPNWGLLPDNANITSFCNKFGLSSSDMLTDERFG